jgi:transposase
MESTSIYWIPIFELLEARGFEVFLVNARDAKHVPGRKTDYVGPGYHRHYDDGYYRGERYGGARCRELRLACLHKEELGEQGMGNCRRYRELCR